MKTQQRLFRVNFQIDLPQIIYIKMLREDKENDHQMLLNMIINNLKIKRTTITRVKVKWEIELLIRKMTK